MTGKEKNLLDSVVKKGEELKIKNIWFNFQYSSIQSIEELLTYLNNSFDKLKTFDPKIKKPFSFNY